MSIKDELDDIISIAEQTGHVITEFVLFQHEYDELLAECDGSLVNTNQNGDFYTYRTGTIRIEK